MSKKTMKRGLLGLALAATVMGSGSAFALLPVVDPLNLVVNTLTALKMHVVMNNTGVTADNTGKIVSINSSILAEIQQARANLDRIKVLEENNYAITNEFNDNSENCYYCIYYGSETGDPIPTGIDRDVAAMLKDAGIYTANYRDANAYGDNVASKDNLTDVGVVASQQQKRANDALVHTLSAHSSTIEQQEAVLKRLVSDSAAAQGRGNQMQFANAIAGAQAVQLMQIRELMLASSNAQAAAAQADADRTARQTAAAKSVRRNMESAIHPVSTVSTK